MCLMSRLLGQQESRTMWLIVCAMNNRVRRYRLITNGSRPVHEALLTNADTPYVNAVAAAAAVYGL